MQARHVRALLARLDLDKPRDFQFSAQLTLSHELMLRGAELCHLVVDNVRFAHGGMVEVTIGGAKTNRGKPPFSVWLADAGSPRMPSAARSLRQYYRKMGWALRVPEAEVSPPLAVLPLFLKLEDRRRTFATVKGNKALSVSAWRKQLRFWLDRAGFPSLQFGSHGMRAGGNTDLLAFGLRPSFVAAAGRWSSGEWRKYNRPDAQLIATQARVALDAAYRAATRHSHA